MHIICSEKEFNTEMQWPGMRLSLPPHTTVVVEDENSVEICRYMTSEDKAEYILVNVNQHEKA